MTFKPVTFANRKLLFEALIKGVNGAACEKAAEKLKQLLENPRADSL